MTTPGDFGERLRLVHPGVDARESYGWSNLPVMLPGAFRFGQFNIHNTDFAGLYRASKELAFVTRVPLPDRQLDLALVFQSDALRQAGRRRDEIVAALQARKSDV